PDLHDHCLLVSIRPVRSDPTRPAAAPSEPRTHRGAHYFCVADGFGRPESVTLWTDSGRPYMPIRYRQRKSFGPLKLNFTQQGLSSWSIKIGPWSWNSRSKKNSVDLPGPLSWRQR